MLSKLVPFALFARCNLVLRVPVDINDTNCFVVVYLFLARLNNVQEELLYYARHRRWRQHHRPQILMFDVKVLGPHYFQIL